MASVQRTAQGTWRAQVDCKGVRRSKTFRAEADARAWSEAQESRLRAKHEMSLAAAHTMLATLVPKRLLRAMAAAPHSLKEVLEATVPAHTFTGVYFLVKDDEVVYVGQSVDLLHRISRHRREGREFDSYAYILCERERLDELEEVYISAFMPWLNHSLGRAKRQSSSANQD